MAPGRSAWWFLLIGICGACWLLSLVAAASVAADPPVYAPPAESATEPPAPESQPSCPTLELAPFEGEDAAAGELRLLREELAESCAALSARLDRVRERTWWLIAESLRSQEQAATANTLLDLVGDRLQPPLEVKASEAVEVQDPGSIDVADAVDASGEALKESVWFLIGLSVTLYAAYALYRQVFPRA